MFDWKYPLPYWLQTLVCTRRLSQGFQGVLHNLQYNIATYSGKLFEDYFSEIAQLKLLTSCQILPQCPCTQRGFVICMSKYYHGVHNIRNFQSNIYIFVATYMPLYTSHYLKFSVVLDVYFVWQGNTFVCSHTFQMSCVQ